jgi:hypothetical protein
MSKVTADIARLPLLLHELRLPAISRLWQGIATRADKEGWPATRFLAALAEIRSPSAPSGASSATLPKHAWRRAKRSTTSTSRRCR